jgi:hypothetical protein
MKKLIFTAIFLLISVTSWATSTVDLQVSDYTFYFHFGDGDLKLIDAFIGTKDSKTSIFKKQMNVEVFDVKEKRMVIKYKSVPNTIFPPDFYININDKKGKIIIGERSYTKFEIDWTY